MLDARLIELEHERLADEAALAHYANLAEGREGSLRRASCRWDGQRPACGGRRACRRRDDSIVKLLSANDASLLPMANTLAAADDPLKATLAMAERAARAARPLVKALPRPERVVFMPLAAIGADLASFRRVRSGDLIGASRWRRQLAMWWAQ